MIEKRENITFSVIYLVFMSIVIVFTVFYLKGNSYVELNTGLPIKAIEELKKLLGY